MNMSNEKDLQVPAKKPNKSSNRPNWTVAGIMAVKNTNWGLCA